LAIDSNFTPALPWERPGPRKYDSLDPDFLGTSHLDVAPATGTASTGEFKTGPTFYHYHGGKDNPQQTIAYDNGNLREFFKERRTPNHHHNHHRPKVDAFEFDEKADPDSQESMIRINTTSSC
jgi:hypothetical protein